MHRWIWQMRKEPHQSTRICPMLQALWSGLMNWGTEFLSQCMLLNSLWIMGRYCAWSKSFFFFLPWSSIFFKLLDGFPHLKMKKIRLSLRYYVSATFFKPDPKLNCLQYLQCGFFTGKWDRENILEVLIRFNERQGALLKLSWCQILKKFIFIWSLWLEKNKL